MYHSVFSFTTCLRVKSADDDKSVARNLDQCLLGKAQRWYTEEISATTRAGLHTSIDLWCGELEARFRESPNIAQNRLEKARYTINDARARKDHEEYIQSIIACGKNAETATTANARVRTAYKHLDVQLRVMLPIPTDATTISQCLGHVQATKPNWFDFFKSYSNTDRRPNLGKQFQPRRDASQSSLRRLNRQDSHPCSDSCRFARCEPFPGWPGLPRGPERQVVS